MSSRRSPTPPVTLALLAACALAACSQGGGAAPKPDEGGGGQAQGSGGKGGRGAQANGGKTGGVGGAGGTTMGSGGKEGAGGLDGGGGSAAGGSGGAGSGGVAGGSGAGGAPNGGGSGGRADVDAGLPDAAAATCVPGTGSEEVGTASVLDRRTCLLWQRTAGAMLTNKQAAKHCAELVLDGHDDWRVPAPEELATWPRLIADSNAYITNPIYVPAASSEQEGCTNNSHSCNLAEYNLGTSTCAWQGVGFAGRTVCVRGAAAAGTLPAAFAAASCTPCKEHLGGAAPEFKLANCLPYAQ